MINPELLFLFNLFCLVAGVFFGLYFVVKMIQGGRASLYTVLLTLVMLTWGIYSVVGVQP